MRLFIIFLIGLGFAQCTNSNKYTIKKYHVGRLTPETTDKDIKNIYLNDSLVYPYKGNNKDLMNSTIYVYSRKGKHLLTINMYKKDSVFKVDNVQIYSRRYKTVKGLSINSTFKNIEENYDINKIETTFSSAIIFVNELNATITIDKKELGISANSNYKIVKEQIPNQAKFKYFTIWMN